MDKIEVPDVEDIIQEYLVKNGYGGLVDREGQCGCKMDDFHACGDQMYSCQPAYLWENACKDCSNHCEGYDESGKNYCMRLEKQPPEENCQDCTWWDGRCIKSSSTKNFCINNNKIYFSPKQPPEES